MSVATCNISVELHDLTRAGPRAKSCFSVLSERLIQFLNTVRNAYHHQQMFAGIVGACTSTSYSTLTLTNSWTLTYLQMPSRDQSIWEILILLVTGQLLFPMTALVSDVSRSISKCLFCGLSYTHTGINNAAELQYRQVFRCSVGTKTTRAIVSKGVIRACRRPL
jgi:hypothetical protein